jgi:hypothetical protein
MRFRYKRPKIDDVREELTTLIDVMSSTSFIFVDLFVYSFFFTLLLSPVLHTLANSVLFFGGCYIFFTSLYYFIFKGPLKKKLDF